MNQLDTHTQQFLQDLSIAENSIPEIQKIQEIKDQIETAKTYQILLDNGLFETRNVYTDRVEGEIHQFIVGRLQVLLGLGNAPLKVSIDSVFTEDEVGVLKAISKKILDGNLPKIETQEPQLKTVKTKPKELPVVKQAKEIKKNQIQQTNDEVVKKKEENEKEEGKVSAGKSPALIIPANHPAMPNEQQMAVWAQTQALGAGAVMSSSTTKL